MTSSFQHLAACSLKVFYTKKTCIINGLFFGQMGFRGCSLSALSCIFHQDNVIRRINLLFPPTKKNFSFPPSAWDLLLRRKFGKNSTDIGTFSFTWSDRIWKMDYISIALRYFMGRRVCFALPLDGSKSDLFSLSVSGEITPAGMTVQSIRQ